MSQTVYGNLELHGKIFPFLLDGHYVHIVQQAFQNSEEFIEKDYSSLRGVTSDNRDILTAMPNLQAKRLTILPMKKYIRLLKKLPE